MATERRNAIAAAALIVLAAGCATTTTSGGGGVSTRPDVEPFVQPSTVVPFEATSTTSPDPVFNILLVANRDDYGASPADNPDFLADARDAIEFGFNGVQGFYLNRDHFHYYISAVAGAVSYDATCVRKDFSGVASDVRVGDDHAVFDLRLILHKQGWPDCREGRKASADAGDFGVIAHEAAHALFNIPDEYGGWGAVWTTEPGIMFEAGDRAACENRRGAFGYVGADRRCDQVTYSSEAFDWWRADRDEDLMSIRQENRAVAVEFGRADWEAARRVMRDKLGVGAVNDPTVFAPSEWPRP